MAESIERKVAVAMSELDALRTLHDYFLDRCEDLFFAMGMEPVDLVNKAALARRIAAAPTVDSVAAAGA